MLGLITITGDIKLVLKDATIDITVDAICDKDELLHTFDVIETNVTDKVDEKVIEKGFETLAIFDFIERSPYSYQQIVKVFKEDEFHLDLTYEEFINQLAIKNMEILNEQ